MSTAAEIRLAALVALLSGASIGASVERSRAIAFERDDLPAAVIKPKSEESAPHGAGLLRCILDVEIEVHTRGDVPDQLADPVAEAIDQAIRGDSSLGGLATKVFRSGKEWEFTDSDGTGGKLTIMYQIHYIDRA